MAIKDNQNPTKIVRSDAGLEKMEDYLVRNLWTVQPRQEFVQHLRGRLVQPVAKPSNTDHAVQSVFLKAVGLIGSILILIASIKATLSLIEAYKILHRQKSIS